MLIPRSHLAQACTVCAALLTLALAACGDKAAAKTEEQFEAVKQREPTPVLVQPVARREMVRRLETTTRVESEQQVQVVPRSSGLITELAVEEGQTVLAGQKLAQLDDRDTKLRLSDSRAALDEARANLPKLALSTREADSRKKSAALSFEQSERDHNRNTAISHSEGSTPGLISSKDLEASQLAVDSARSELEMAQLTYERSQVEEKNGEAAVRRAELAVQRVELELSFLQITAPIAGVIAERSIKVGDTVRAGSSATPGLPAFVVTDPDQLRAVFYRPQRELLLFHVPVEGSNGHSQANIGAELEIRAFAEALPNKEFRGRIERVAPTIDAASGNFRVTTRLEPAAIDDAGAKLLPGMLVRIEIITERHPDALVVPKRAIRREGDRNRVFVVRDNVAHGVEIEEGFSDDLDVEVRGANGAQLAVGDLVVVVGNRELEEGSPVRVADEKAAASVPAPAPEPAPAGGD